MQKILIVDDSAFMRSVLKDLLLASMPDIDVYEADGKVAALDQVKKLLPSLVLLDMVMRDNEFEGLEILREIKEFYPATHVIMITSVGQLSVVEECKSLGVVDYINKPFDRDHVVASVRKYINQ